jgi:hypothetical protein
MCLRVYALVCRGLHVTIMSVPVPFAYESVCLSSCVYLFLCVSAYVYSCVPHVFLCPCLSEVVLLGLALISVECYVPVSTHARMHTHTHTHTQT